MLPEDKLTSKNSELQKLLYLNFHESYNHQMVGWFHIPNGWRTFHVLNQNDLLTLMACDVLRHIVLSLAKTAKMWFIRSKFKGDIMGVTSWKTCGFGENQYQCFIRFFYMDIPFSI